MAPREITVTLDLEDHRPDPRLPKRYDVMTEKLLEFFREQRIQATIFTVGKLAENDPDLVRRAAAAGHEIALHSYDHTPIVKQTPKVFRDHTKRAKGILEDVTGREIVGYRAPIFSLTKDCLWAVEILRELGFLYSSSILPAASPLYGFPELSSPAFLWSNGLLEIPAPVARFGPFTLPYLGGFYFRYLPAALIRKQIGKAAQDDCLWTYFHPYDFDPDERNPRIEGAAPWVSLLLWFNRGHTFRKLRTLVSGGQVTIARPFKEQIAEGAFDRITKTVDPATFAQA